MYLVEYPISPLADNLIALRSWRESDIEGGLKTMNESDTRFYYFENREDTPEEFYQSQQASFEEGTAIHLAITNPEDDEIVYGCVSLHSIRYDHSRAELGCWIDSRYRENDYALRACRLIVRWAFDYLEAKRINIICDPENTAVIEGAKKHGFVFEGILRSNVEISGQRRDEAVFSLLPSDITS